ncbi:cytochrome c oxidase subunit I [Luteimonas aestuarii]|uniref:cytochrome-c oxidase n=1 Tax=Luteimonas aestuarii TaxID=453837 RepID=A0A4R5TSN4_9GAMM|nr:cytochrome c oxidase subunit I [Luteimonas aestuarii]TDK23347.1 cytochrome c oxidase subunit I [Luteimonas aestuarii]
MSDAATHAGIDAAEHDRRLAELDRIWCNEPGVRGQLRAVNHGTVGLRFIAAGLAFMLVGGLLSMFIRLQLAWFDAEVLDPERFNQFVTLHGTTMMFLFAVPVMEGFAMYLLPKMIGARDLPFPRMSAFGWWCYLFGGLFLYSSLLFDAAPDGGWFMYVPLTDATFSPGMGPDFWLIGVTFAEIAAVTAAVELVVAILVTRAPGMDIRRMPLFAWAILVMAFMIALGFPPLILASILLEIQRAFGFVFFDPALGGDPLLWQHLFWLFGHPEVYIIFLPAAGVVSMVVATFARRPIVGHTWIVLALVGTGFLSFGLWVHHMFTVGIPLLALAFFSAASMAVAIPTAIQVFAWIATLWSGRPWLRVPMLHIFGFFFVFVLGGLTGVMLAFVPFDWQAHDTHFVVAHMHYVLIGGMMFPLFAGLYYWLPLASGRMPSESTSRTAFWLVFIGFNLTFLPMHLTGLLGMPRRAYTYPEELGVHWLNLLSTAAGFVLAVGIIAILVDAALCFVHGRRGRGNPWRAGTLEWAVPQPVPNYNFASIPRVEARYPLWQDRGLAARVARADGWLGDPASGRREMLGTGVVSAKPEQVVFISSSSWWPIACAALIALMLALFISKQYLLSAACVPPLAASFMAWAWTTGHRRAPLRVDAGQGLQLPSQYAARNAPGWWGVVVTMLIDGSLFASLVFAYFYLWLGADAWPPPGIGDARLALAPVVAVAMLGGAWLSSHLADRAFRAQRTTRTMWLAGVAALAALGYLLLYPPAVSILVGVPQAHAYASLVWMLAGFCVVHVAVAVLMVGFAIARMACGYVDAARSLEWRVASTFLRYALAQAAIGWTVVHLFPLVQG